MTTKKKRPTEAPSSSRSGSVFTSGEGPYIQVDFTTTSDIDPMALGLLHRLLQEQIYGCIKTAINAELGND